MNEEFKIEVLIKKSLKELQTAELLIQNNLFNAAVSRTYYAMFYAVQVLFIEEKIVTSSHHGMITIFSKQFVKTGIFSGEMGKQINKIFEMRQSSDYNFDFEITLDTAINTLTTGKKFVETLFTYVKNKNLL
ncbi:MAG TPA: HEPN domain-containing protein [Bacteroidales bacterium]|nr:HEPN domain-containing protein [Bacteroidales bacterium]